MKKLHKLVLSLFVISLILPNLVFASWWNPFSWNIYKWLFVRPIKTENIIVSTSTIKSVASTTNSNIVNKPVIDNSAVIKAQVDAQVKATLKAKVDEDAKIAQQKIDDQAKIDAAAKAQQDAANLAAQNAANLAAQQQAQQDAVNQAVAQAQSVKQTKLDAVNLQIANLNAKYTQDIARAKVMYSGMGTAPVAAGNTAIAINKINTQYDIDYANLTAQYQQILYGN
jgi:multidrug efflux pump subunit AcrA (membrane-fusion protein)